MQRVKMLIDGFGRKIDYLRISLTERCNFRCQYCMPEKPFSWVPKENLLSFEELFLFVKTAIDEGITKIRITGGEPTLREGLDIFIKMISDYKNDLDLALTTNGFLLKNQAQKLKDAGLKRINISLDSLKRETLENIAKKDVLFPILDGIDECVRLGFKIKINMVPLQGLNDDEIVDMLEFAKSKGVEIRYIEYMENIHANSSIKGLDEAQIKEIISKKYSFSPLPKDISSPARVFMTDDGYKFGIIDPHKHDFCEGCNRIRLTAEGFLIPCLYFEDAMSIKESIEAGDVAGAAEILRKVIQNKPEKNKWGVGENETSARAFFQTGG